MRIKRHHLPMSFALLHAALFFATVTYVYKSSTGQAALVWVFWAVIDLPVSLLYLLAPAYSRFVNELVGQTAFAHILYFPHLIHGLLGTIWWYFLCRFVLALAAHRRIMRPK